MIAAIWYDSMNNIIKTAQPTKTNLYLPILPMSLRFFRFSWAVCVSLKFITENNTRLCWVLYQWLYTIMVTAAWLMFYLKQLHNIKLISLSKIRQISGFNLDSEQNESNKIIHVWSSKIMNHPTWTKFNLNYKYIGWYLICCFKTNSSICQSR